MGVDFTGQSIYFKLHFYDYHIFENEYEGLIKRVARMRHWPEQSPGWPEAQAGTRTSASRQLCVAASYHGGSFCDGPAVRQAASSL
jgi:hypothetical protein